MPLTISERANPLKDGDAKPRVYRHRRSDHDSQVAEDGSSLDLREPGSHSQALSF